MSARSGSGAHSAGPSAGPAAGAPGRTGRHVVSPRAALASIRPYVPGRPAPDMPGALKLASNENPFGPSPRAVAAIREAASGVHRYPDASATDLKAAIAARHGLEPAFVLVGNGSDDVIHLLAAAYLEPGRLVVLPDPPYAIHRIVAEAAGAARTLVPLRHGVHDLQAMAAAAEPGGWVVVTNPHNPTGSAVRPADLRTFLAGIRPDVLVLLDEAYFDFADDEHRVSGADVLRHQPNLVVLRTFSKAYGLAGLRVGYALAHPEVLEPVERIRPPFNVGVPAQAGALAALDDVEHLARTVAGNAAARTAFVAACERLGLEMLPSQTNFVLVRGERSGGAAAAGGAGTAGSDGPGTRHGWPEALADAGIVVRPGANLGAPGWYRVSLGTPGEMARVAALIETALRP